MPGIGGCVGASREGEVDHWYTGDLCEQGVESPDTPYSSFTPQEHIFFFPVNWSEKFLVFMDNMNSLQGTWIQVGIRSAGGGRCPAAFGRT